VSEAVSSGKYGRGSTDEPPESMVRRFHEPNPDWDWCGTAGWYVMRIFDDGLETERLLLRCVQQRTVG